VAAGTARAGDAGRAARGSASPECRGSSSGPNLLIFGTFTFLPIIINFYYAFTGGVNLFPSERPFTGMENLEILFECRNYLDPSTCRKDIFWQALFNTAKFAVLQVGLMVVLSVITGARPQSQDHRPRLLARRFLLSGAAVAGRRRADLEVDPAKPGPAERPADRYRRRSRPSG
jgi:ABC-type Fe3+ transport system permease subunit